MLLNKLTLINFKNYREATLQFHPQVNCFTGNNGSGKTNLLDAIHYLSMTRSYFTGTDAQNILHSEPMMVIQGEFEKNGSVDSVLCSVKPGQKKLFTRNKEEYNRLSDHIGEFPVVMIAPTDQELITDGSAMRRKFMDSIISQYDHAYLDDLIRYNQVLFQRNALLKQAAGKGGVNWNNFSVWDDQLILYGNRIYECRKEFVQGFIPFFQRLFNFISDNAEHVGIIYESSLEKQPYEHLLNSARGKDLALQYTTCGVHKDDLIFTLKEFPARKFASQGQQRSLVVALKLAHFSYLCSRGFTKPIVLLDDIFDKLDELRVARLMELVSREEFGQLFITDTHHNRVSEILNKIGVSFTLFQVADGLVALEPTPMVSS